MKKLLVLCFSVIFLASFAAFAEDDGKAAPFYMPKAEDAAGDYPNIKIGGQTFFNWTFTRAAGLNANAFNINRALLNAYGDVAENWFYGLAIDIAPLFNLVNQSITLSNGTTAIAANANPGDVHLDSAYFGYNFGEHKIMLGVIDTAFEGYVLYNVWHHRRIGWSPLLGNGYSVASRWDLGLAVAGGFLEDVVEYHFGVYNGESYLNITEITNHKSFQARITLKPLKEMLAFSVGMEYDKPNAAAGNQVVVPVIIAADLMEGMVKPGLIFAWERFNGNNAYMISFMGNIYLMEDKVNPFLRFDYGLKNEIVAIGGPTLGKKDYNIFAGVGYHFNKHVVIDMAFIWSHVEVTDANSYTFGPFAEVRF